MEAEKARLLEQAAAIDHDLAELRRLSEKYGFILSPKNPADHIVGKAAIESSSEPARSGKQTAGGSIGALIVRYHTDPKSPFQKLRFRTKENYAGCLKRIAQDFGDKKLADLKRQDIERMHKHWMARGETMARSLIAILRLLVNYGATELEDGDCVRLSVVLRNMRFKMVKHRSSESLSADQVTAIRQAAHKHGWGAIALAQAFQFDCKLRQRDCIGEWVPMNEPGESNIFQGDKKWLRGLRWTSIDRNKILCHITSMRNKVFRIDLPKSAPMVMEEFELQFPNGIPTSHTPIIVDPRTEQPFEAWEFRRLWRQVARAAGVPDNVFNMHTAAKRSDTLNGAYSNGHDVSYDDDPLAAIAEQLRSSESVKSG